MHHRSGMGHSISRVRNTLSWILQIYRTGLSEVLWWTWWGYTGLYGSLWPVYQTSVIHTMCFSKSPCLLTNHTDSLWLFSLILVSFTCTDCRPIHVEAGADPECDVTNMPVKLLDVTWFIWWWCEHPQIFVNITVIQITDCSLSSNHAFCKIMLHHHHSPV